MFLFVISVVLCSVGCLGLSYLSTLKYNLRLFWYSQNDLEGLTLCLPRKLPVFHISFWNPFSYFKFICLFVCEHLSVQHIHCQKTQHTAHSNNILTPICSGSWMNQVGDHSDVLTNSARSLQKVDTSTQSHSKLEVHSENTDHQGPWNMYINEMSGDRIFNTFMKM